jgi:hypothetical protein
VACDRAAGEIKIVVHPHDGPGAGFRLPDRLGGMADYGALLRVVVKKQQRLLRIELGLAFVSLPSPAPPGIRLRELASGPGRRERLAAKTRKSGRSQHFEAVRLG